MIKKHRQLLAKIMDTYKLDNYQVAWLAFIKGIVIWVILTLIFK